MDLQKRGEECKIINIMLFPYVYQRRIREEQDESNSIGNQRRLIYDYNRKKYARYSFFSNIRVCR